MNPFLFVLDDVIVYAEEAGTDPNGEAMNTIAIAVTRGDKVSEMPPDVKRSLVVMCSYPVVAETFQTLAGKTWEKKALHLVTFKTSQDEGFDQAFQELRAAKAIKDFADANVEVSKQMVNNVEKWEVDSTAVIGKSIASLVDHRLKL